MKRRSIISEPPYGARLRPEDSPLTLRLHVRHKKQRKDGMRVSFALTAKMTNCMRDVYGLIFIEFGNVIVAQFFPLIHLPLLVFVLPSRGHHGSCLTFMHSFVGVVFWKRRCLFRRVMTMH